MTVTMKITAFWDVMHQPGYIVSSQKITLFIVSAMRTTTPTFKSSILGMLTKDLLIKQFRRQVSNDVQYL
jgi:hypothetical protein